MEFLSDDLLFNNNLICTATVGFHAAGNESTTGKDADLGIEPSSGGNGFKDSGITRDSQDQQRRMLDAGSTKDICIANVAFNHVIFACGATLDRRAV